MEKEGETNTTKATMLVRKCALTPFQLEKFCPNLVCLLILLSCGSNELNLQEKMKAATANIFQYFKTTLILLESVGSCCEIELVHVHTMNMIKNVEFHGLLLGATYPEPRKKITGMFAIFKATFGAARTLLLIFIIG